ncbi:DUF4262 domain-containing protein [Olivibacter sp. CPCC 100613]|uniref:DUF4262 domain-containing protein n=1 Tax=Olivibacter sp. CPCC 100613 TaxID=3079931 RepID=UPI002FF66A34
MENKQHSSLNHAQLEKSLQETGWYVVMIEGTAYQPSFAYTIGLWRNFGHPELIAFGLPLKTMHLILNDIGQLVKRGEKMQVNKSYQDFLQDYLTTFITVEPRNMKDYFGAAIEYYDSFEIRAIQFIWPDKNHHFPWEQGFEPSYKYLQPLLDRNADFKFREEKNLAVFTTRQWLEDNAPILEVYHDDDGDWQFITGQWKEDDIRTVALEEILKRDPSINDLFNLDYGEQALRLSPKEKWQRDNH